MSSSYPHDRDWEIPPDERPSSSSGNHKTPYTEPIAQAAASQGSSSSSQVQRTSQRNGNGRLQRQRSRRAYYGEEDDDDEPGILSRLLTAIFAPILGFIIISGISLTWSGLLFGVLMAYTAAGNPLTWPVLLLSVLVWMTGFKILMSVLYYGN